MPISHLCTTCGLDLARERACPDPHYGLPVVVCPKCGSAAVRLAHPWRPTVRRVIGVATAIAAMMTQVVVLGMLVGFSIAACVAGGAGVDRAGDGWVGQTPGWSVVGLGLLGLAAGFWFTAPLSHWRGISAWIVYAVIVFLALSVDTIIGPAITRVALAWGADGNALGFRPEVLMLRSMVLGAILVATLGGVPIGWLVLRAEAWRRNYAWRLALRRRRSRRRMVA